MKKATFKYMGKPYVIPDGQDNTMNLRVVEFIDGSGVAIEWAAMDYSETLERWKKFKRKSPKPVTVAEARTLIKDFKKAEAKRGQQVAE